MSRVPEWFQGQPDPNEAEAKRVTEYVKAAIKLASQYKNCHIYCPVDPAIWRAFEVELEASNIILDKVAEGVYTWRFHFGPWTEGYGGQDK